MSDSRRILHSAYSFIRSVESNKAISSLTLDHVLQEHITSLKKGEMRGILDGSGKSLGSRSSRFDQIEELERDLDKLVRAVKGAGDDRQKLADLGLTDDKDAE